MAGLVDSFGEIVRLAGISGTQAVGKSGLHGALDEPLIGVVRSYDGFDAEAQRLHGGWVM